MSNKADDTSEAEDNDFASKRWKRENPDWQEQVMEPIAVGHLRVRRIVGGPEWPRVAATDVDIAKIMDFDPNTPIVDAPVPCPRFTIADDGSSVTLATPTATRTFPVDPSSWSPPTRWWLSWTQVDPDVRPDRWPPPPEVVGFWPDEDGLKSNAHGEARTIAYALVEADSEADARAVVEQVWTVGAWRFCRQRLDDSPPGGRFPPPEWSVEMGRWPWPT